MGKGGDAVGSASLKSYSWDEIREHTASADRWIVIEGHIYDITRWQAKHPGGAKIIGHFAGQDATEAWTAMHNDKTYINKFMKPLLVGKVAEYENNNKQNQMKEDMIEIRQTAEKMGLFKVNPMFYILHFVHVIVLEIVGFSILWMYGTGWLPFLAAAVILTIAQAQAGWTQHDYGHLSVFNNSTINHIIHHIVIGHFKGASSHWWNFRHFQHHAKPNVFKKDPDITLPYVFLLGTKIPHKWGTQKRGVMPYQWQHGYFWFLGPMFLLPVYFQFEVSYFVIKRRDWVDLFFITTFFVRFFYIYTPMLGGWGAFGLYMFIRLMESFWFTFVTQMSHLPMEIDTDQETDWLTHQTISTCNVEPGFFNDWFSGHLNYQIEHHLFPMMPRHNYCKVAPLVQSLCKKHNLPYTVKPLGTAFADILRSLKKSGNIWYDAYYEM